MKREGLWLVAILVLVALSVFALVKLKPKYGLDIKGGVRAILQANPKPGQKFDQSAVVKILHQRIDIAGVGETTVQPKGDNQFIVEIPDTKNKDEVIQRLGTAAQMQFYYFKEVQSRKNSFARYQYDDSGRLAHFTDTQTKQTFRDQAQIADDFQKAAQKQRPARRRHRVQCPDIHDWNACPGRPDPVLRCGSDRPGGQSWQGTR